MFSAGVTNFCNTVIVSLVSSMIFLLSFFLIVTESENMLPRHLSPEVAAALKSVRFIAQHIKDADKDNEVSDLCDKRNLVSRLLAPLA